MKKLLISALAVWCMASYAMMQDAIVPDVPNVYSKKDCFIAYTKYFELLQSCNQHFNYSMQKKCVIDLHESFIKECKQEKTQRSSKEGKWIWGK
jgi:hypothetical protein